MLRLLLSLALLFVLFGVASNSHAEERGREADVFSEAELTPFEHAKIESIRIHGLERTHEKAVRWLLRVHEGDDFSSHAWIDGIKRLYNTTVLYKLDTQIKETKPAPARAIEIELFAKEKWTTLPYATAYGGGGSQYWGGGIFDTNLTGYFTNASLGIAYLDSVPAYDISVSQDWIRGSNFLAGLDLSRAGKIVDLIDRGGTKFGEFTWFRDQVQLLGGYHPKEKTRITSYFELYRDKVGSNNSLRNGQIFTTIQYRIRPTLIFGRSDFTNFLETGQEISIAPAAANFHSAETSIYQLVLNYKRTIILLDDANFAYNFNAGIMTEAPPAYQFRLGGLDTVRGYTADRFIGDRYLTSMFEFRPKLFSFQVHVLELNRLILQGCLFVDSGLISGNNSFVGSGSAPRVYRSLVSAGAGLRGIAEKFSGAIVRLDMGQTISPREGWDLSFGVGQMF